MQAVAFSAGWYLPASHRAQTLRRELAAIVPGAHAAGAVAPAAHAEPAGHATQSLCECPPDDPR